jgi:hypothetical protein
MQKLPTKLPHHIDETYTWQAEVCENCQTSSHTTSVKLTHGKPKDDKPNDNSNIKGP